MSEVEPGMSRAGKLISALKFLLAGLILTLVMRSLPWRDEVTLSDAAGRHAFPGTIVGDWKGALISFRFEADLAIEKLPHAWRTQVGDSRTVELSRSVLVDWRPGMPNVFRSVEPSGLVLAFVLVFVGVLGQTTRWWRLLASVGCSMAWYNVLRLNLYGLFFNLVAPGLTGGDVFRAVLVAREHPGRRAAAAISVLIDRLMGVLILALLCAIVILIEGDRFSAVRNPVLFLLLGAGVAMLLYFNPVLRRVVNVARWLERMPMSRSLSQIDEAFLVYSKQPYELLLAAALSIGIHVCISFGILMLGRAFGDETLSFLDYLAVTSIGNIAGALPVTPGGWGVGEAVYQYLFEMTGGDGTIGVAVSIGYKLVLALIGLSGGIFLLLPSGRRQIAALREAASGP